MELHVSTWINLTNRMSRGKKLQKNLCGLPGWCSGKEFTCQGRRWKRHRFNSWVRKIPGEGNSNSLQYSCWENSMDRGAWRATVHRVAKSRPQLSTREHMSYESIIWCLKTRKTYCLLFRNVCKCINTLLTGNILIHLCYQNIIDRKHTNITCITNRWPQALVSAKILQSIMS